MDPRHRLSISVHGVGGTGSFLLSKLARLNVILQELNGYPGLHVTAYDGDKIEDHNYVRSTFSPADAGMPKATTIMTRINRYYGLKWVAHDRHFTREDENTNIVFLCVDSLKARKEIISLLSLKGYHNSLHLYTFDIGNEKSHGQIILSESSANNPDIKDMSKMSWDYFPMTEDASSASCSMRESLSAQSVFINEWMAVLAAEMLKEFILSPVMPYNAIFTNLEDMNISKTFLI